MSKKPKTYIVWEGRQPGIYQTWAECKAQTDGVKARFKSYEGLSPAEARRLFDAGPPPSSPKVGRPKSASDATPKKRRGWQGLVPPDAWTVDAATSGNPGPTEYRCVVVETGDVVFASKVYPRGTNNLGEFLAIVHALAYMKQVGYYPPLYSDSKTALSWIRKKAYKTTLARTPETDELFRHLDRAIYWLQTNDLTPYTLLLWDTPLLGEIPADYGRK